MDSPYRDDYPFAGRTFDRGGLRLHYLDEGQGDPVVMVHGNPTWSFYYRRVIQAVRGAHRAIVPDHIGCGLSDKPGDDRYDYTLQSRIDDLDALLEHLNVRGNVTLLLHDWGGAIGMGYAVRHPERIRRIALLNTAAFLKPPGKAMPAALGLVRTPPGALLVRGFNAFARGTAWIGCTRRRMPKPLRDAYCAPYDSWANRIATLRFVEDIPLHPGDRAYGPLSQTQAALEAGLFRDIPTAIFWGMRDFVFDHHFLDRWIELWPGAEVYRFEDCGHYVLEDAADEIVPLFTRFLAEHPLR